jgi:single-strand DNA-binding protein
MARDNSVSVVGNLTRDPELRFTPSGAAVANFGLAWNKRRQNRQTQEWEDEPSFFDVTCWNTLAENVAESLTKGSRVIVYGHLEWRSWETPDGGKASKVEIIADEVAPSLRWATASVTRNERSGAGGGGGGAGWGGGSAPVPSEPPAYDPNEEPF